MAKCATRRGSVEYGSFTQDKTKPYPGMNGSLHSFRSRPPARAMTLFGQKASAGQDLDLGFPPFPGQARTKSPADTRMGLGPRAHPTPLGRGRPAPGARIPPPSRWAVVEPRGRGPRLCGPRQPTSCRSRLPEVRCARDNVKDAWPDGTKKKIVKSPLSPPPKKKTKQTEAFENWGPLGGESGHPGRPPAFRTLNPPNFRNYSHNPARPGDESRGIRPSSREPQDPARLALRRSLE